jgi:hypothetical protein
VAAIEIVRGDITEEQTQAIVKTAAGTVTGIELIRLVAFDRSAEKLLTAALGEASGG